MLAAHPIPRTPRRAHRPSQAPLRIYSPTSSSPTSSSPAAPATPSASRCGETKAIGELLPQVLARYLSRAEGPIALARG